MDSDEYDIELMRIETGEYIRTYITASRNMKKSLYKNESLTNTIIHKLTELFAKAGAMGYFYRYLKSLAYG
ncbi:hypothetical protein JYB62_16680 [Algoriphagus lutimaris]|uniref:hypothetical protein n=1 Tax=Algoriphagus lutimaris TaxID=613197 RepID=UPI00196AA5A6|nr:hypothetical protein [Algoriphagus lutimaris]MBN3521649.1 hypothetical protein [Algoriphagus lutimaris]